MKVNVVSMGRAYSVTHQMQMDLNQTLRSLRAGILGCWKCTFFQWAVIYRAEEELQIQNPLFFGMLEICYRWVLWLELLSPWICYGVWI